jgi:hypothetical protein
MTANLPLRRSDSAALFVRGQIGRESRSLPHCKIEPGTTLVRYFGSRLFVVQKNIPLHE